MTTPTKITRRAVLRAGLGAATGAAAGSLLAQSGAAVAGATPAQPAGPFYPVHPQADKDADLTRIEGHQERAAGEVIDISGQVLDDLDNPVANALVDVWQANTHGRYHHEKDPNPAPVDPNFQGWAQIHTDEQGRYRFKTIFPGAYPVDQSWSRPPHIHFKVSKRGYHELTTQMYFAGQALNDKDRLLLEVAEVERKKLIVELTEGAGDDEAATKSGRFNIVMRRVGAG